MWQKKRCNWNSCFRSFLEWWCNYHWAYLYWWGCKNLYLQCLWQNKDWGSRSPGSQLQFRLDHWYRCCLRNSRQQEPSLHTMWQQKGCNWDSCFRSFLEWWCNYHKTYLYWWRCKNLYLQFLWQNKNWGSRSSGSQLQFRLDHWYRRYLFCNWQQEPSLHTLWQ